MMRKLLMAGIAILTIAISSCDEDTNTMGYSLTSYADRFSLIPDTFQIDSMESIKADSVLARSSYSYLGRIKDPETGAYITSDFTTQFTVLEKEKNYIFAPKKDITSLDTDGEPVATSCNLIVIINSYLGDSLTAMKLMVEELDKPIEENKLYYSNFDPEANGYIRNNGLKQAKMYSMVDLTLSDSARAARLNKNYYSYINIPLNKQYKAKDGTVYKNYGTYLMRTYYQHPEYFKNSISFIKNVCPGFYFKTVDGQGVMAEVLNVQMEVKFKYKSNDKEYDGSKIFYGTEEVMQTTHIANEKGKIDSLVNVKNCTYLKTPAGIFTEVTLPVEQIKKGHINDSILSKKGHINDSILSKKGHINDSILSAKITFQRMADLNKKTVELLSDATQLLMIERDSLYSFFEKNNVTNNRTSFLAVYNATLNTYTYNNISSLINHMWSIRGKGSKNWNKVVLVPVKTSTVSTSSYTSATVTGINNEMGITSTRLVGGIKNPDNPNSDNPTISIIYNQSK